MLSFRPAFSLSSFTFIKRLLNSSSLSAIRVVLSAYVRLLIFLLAILLLVCASSSPAFLMMYSASLETSKGRNGACHWYSGKRICLPKQEMQETWVWFWVGSRKWQPTSVFLPGKLHGRRSQAGYSPWGHKELDMTQHACWQRNECFLQRDKMSPLVRDYYCLYPFWPPHGSD